MTTIVSYLFIMPSCHAPTGEVHGRLQRRQWRRGFKTTSKTFFDLAHGADKDYRRYLPDAAFRPMASTNGQFARDILNNKLLFERLLQDHIPIPKVLALVERGEVSTITANATIKDAERLLEYASAWG